MSAAAATLKIVIRYDDFSSTASEDRRLPLERTLFDAVAVLGGCSIVGVIPFPGSKYPESREEADAMPLALSEEKRTLLKATMQSGAAMAALHGFSHRPNGLRTLRSEFAGLEPARQALLIEAAKRALAVGLAADVDIFIPPFNSMDAATLEALESAKFRLVSAGFSPTLPGGSALKLMPGMVYPAHLRRVVDAAVAAGHDDALVTVIIHPYDFKDSGEIQSRFRLDPQIDLEVFVAQLRSLVESRKVTLASAADIESEIGTLTADRYQANLDLRNSWISRHRVLPSSLGLYAVDGVYYSEPLADRLRLLQSAAAVGMLGGLLLLCALAAWLLTRMRFARAARRRSRGHMQTPGAGDRATR